MTSIELIHKIVEEFGEDQKPKLMSKLISLRIKTKMEFRRELSKDLQKISHKLNSITIKKINQ